MCASTVSLIYSGISSADVRRGLRRQAAANADGTCAICDRSPDERAADSLVLHHAGGGSRHCPGCGALMIVPQEERSNLAAKAASILRHRQPVIARWVSQEHLADLAN